MEIKKSAAVNLDRKTTKYFLFGLAVSVLTFLAILQIPITRDDDVPAELLDEILQEMESLPMPDQREQIALQPQKQETVSERIKETDETVSADEEMMEDVAPSADGDASEEKMTVVPTEAVSPLALNENEKAISWRVVEQLPDFPGGMVEFMKWLTRSLKYPDAARRQKIQGTVQVSFIVNKDGSVSDIKLLKSVDKLLDDEALRVVGAMPQWKAGEDNGQPCRTMITIPIVFKL